MEYKFSTLYAVKNGRAYWIEFDQFETVCRYSANNYCSFSDWDQERQVHGYASSPNACKSAAEFRAYFLKELRKLASGQTETFDDVKYSVRRVSFETLEQRWAEMWDPHQV